jgi:hypothetical protein
MLSSLSSSGCARANGVTLGFTNHQARHWLARPALWLLLQADDQQKQQDRSHGCWGHEPAVSPATRRRLVAFPLGSDVVAWSTPAPVRERQSGCLLADQGRVR